MSTSLEQALTFKAPSYKSLERGLGFLKWYFDPEVLGFDNIDRDRPTLFVGNHTRFGMLDVPLICLEIYRETGVLPRGLSDRIHYKLPLWRDLISRAGGVMGSREMCQALMADGQSIMVFPGGAREVVKGRGKNYQLLWENRLGFVRMAIENGYTITPFSSLGADEALDVLVDGDDIMNSVVGRVIKSRDSLKQKIRQDMLFPVGRGIGMSVIPRPEKFYFSIGKPIETAHYAGQSDDESVLRCVQKETATAIEKLLSEALLYRAQSSHKVPVWRKIMNRT